MPFSWNQVNNMPDIASSDRFRLYYPAVNGIDANILSLLTKSVTVPRKAIGHIIVKLGDQSVGFRGGTEFENVLSVRFYENVNGDGMRNIKQWMQSVRNKDGLSRFKSSYAGKGKLEIYNTKGLVIHKIPLINMFPFTKEFPDLDDSNSTGYEFTVEFNVDLADVN